MRVDPRTVSQIAAAVALGGLAGDEAATDRAVRMRARLCEEDAAEVHRQSAAWLASGLASRDDARRAVAYIAERSRRVADDMTRILTARIAGKTVTYQVRHVREKD